MIFFADRLNFAKKVSIIIRSKFFLSSSINRELNDKFDKYAKKKMKISLFVNSLIAKIVETVLITFQKIEKITLFQITLSKIILLEHKV